MFIIAFSIASREGDVCMIDASDIMMCAFMPGCVECWTAQQTYNETFQMLFTARSMTFANFLYLQHH